MVNKDVYKLVKRN